MTAVLHTWGQSLQLHIHLHCIVTGGALSDDRSELRRCKNGFLFSTRAMAEVLGGKYLSSLAKAFAADEIVWPDQQSGLSPSEEFARLTRRLRKHRWVVYAKRPFAGPEEVISYIGRYTHRVAISNNRIVEIKDGQVSFRYKDYREGGKWKVMTLEGEEFIRRFLLHILPEDFVRIRHYGLLANGKKKANLERCRELTREMERKEVKEWEEEEEEGVHERAEEIC